jgi:HAD superfamily hydrolase (TIGR01450 family)
MTSPDTHVGVGENFTVKGGGAFSVSRRFTSSAAEYRAWLLDVDGVLHRCGVAVPGAADFVTHLKERKTPLLLLTNEDRYTNARLVERLKAILGVSLAPDEVYSSSNSAKEFFQRLFRHGFDDSCYVLGEDGLFENVQQAYDEAAVNGRMYKGDEPLDAGARKVTYVVVGCTFSENTRNSERAVEFVRQGARLVYSCPDYYDVMANGSFHLGMAMPLVDLICKICNVTAYNVGKPNSHMLRMALRRLLSDTELQWKDVMFVGDSLGTDIRTSIENGIDCALVLSGTTTPDALARSALQPNFVFPSILELHHSVLAGSVLRTVVEDGDARTPPGVKRHNG